MNIVFLLLLMLLIIIIMGISLINAKMKSVIVFPITQLSLKHLTFERPARRRLPPEFSKSSAPEDTHFVSRVTLSAKHYRHITSGKVKTRRSKQSTLQKVSPIDQCFLNLLSFSSRNQNPNFFEKIGLTAWYTHRP